MAELVKKYPTIGCCGIDCGLCPRFHTQGASACPGCGGRKFKERHPACGCLTCCQVKHGQEVCALCPEYPCARFKTEGIGRDSFVTHAKIFPNHDFINKQGLAKFADQQKVRMDILSTLLANYDDGRSKSFFCLSCALLPLDKLLAIQKQAVHLADTMDRKAKNQWWKNELHQLAGKLKLELKLNHRQ